MDKITLRAHHLLCIEGFEGYGYNDEFVINMKNIISILNKNPDVLVLNSCDDICFKCPNMKEGVCVSENGGEDIVKKMDNNVIKKINITSGMSFSYNELKRNINNLFKTKKDLEGICSVCSWKDICRWYKTKL